MNIYFLTVVIALFFGLYIWIAKRASKQVQTSSDYFLMGRQLTFFPLCMTLLATILGGGVLLGAAQEAYLKGWIVLIYPLGAFLGFMALGLGFGARLRRLNITTVPEIFEVVYQSKNLRWIAAFFSVLSLYFILVAQGIAAKTFFASIGLTNTGWFLLFWLAFVAYTVVGGFKAVVDTDVVQAIFMLIGLGAALVFIDFSQFTLAWNVQQPFIAQEVPWSSWLLMPLCFMLIEQDIAQRCFAAKNPRLIAPAAILAGLLLLGSSSIAIAFGVLANTMQIEILPHGNVLISSIQKLTSPIVSHFFMATIIMAVASSADSLLCSISSNLSADFLVTRKMSEKKQLNLSRTITFGIGLSALALIYLFDSIVTMLIFSYELSVSALFIPVVMAVITSKPSKTGASASITAGVACFIALHLWPPTWPREILSLCASLSFYVAGSFIGNVFSLRAISRRGKSNA